MHYGIHCATIFQSVAVSVVILSNVIGAHIFCHTWARHVFLQNVN